MHAQMGAKCLAVVPKYIFRQVGHSRSRAAQGRLAFRSNQGQMWPHGRVCACGCLSLTGWGRGAILWVGGSLPICRCCRGVGEGRRREIGLGHSARVGEAWDAIAYGKCGQWARLVDTTWSDLPSDYLRCMAGGTIFIST
jgi:hypothetical protein